MAWIYRDIISFLRMSSLDEIKATKDYREAAELFRESGYPSEGNLIDAIADDEDRHANLLMDIQQSIQAQDMGLIPTIYKVGNEVFKLHGIFDIEEQANFEAEWIRSTEHIPVAVQKILNRWVVYKATKGRTGSGTLWELKEHYPEEYEAMRPERSGVVVTITNSGDTSWEIGDTIASEEFDLENDKMRSLGKRPALGEYHY